MTTARSNLPLHHMVFVLIALFLAAGCDGADGTGVEVNVVSTVAYANPDKAMYFYSKGCPDCAWVEEHVLPTLTELYEDDLLMIDVETDDITQVVGEMEQHFGVHFPALAPILVVSGEVYPDRSAIEAFHESRESR